MDNLASICDLFENLPKQKKCKCFLKFFKVDLNLSKIKQKETTRLAKTRRVDTYKDYYTYHLLYKAKVFTFDSIKTRNLHDESYKHLEEKFSKNWTWDAATKIKVQGLFVATKLLEYILTFSLVSFLMG